MRVKETVKIHWWGFFLFFPSSSLSFYNKEAKETIYHPMKDLVTQYTWYLCSETLLQKGFITILLGPIFRRRGNILVLLQSLQMTAQNPNKDIIKSNASSYYFILSKKKFSSGFLKYVAFLKKSCSSATRVKVGLFCPCIICIH